MLFEIIATRFDTLKADIKRFGWMRGFYKMIVWVAARYLGIHVFLVRIRPTEEKPVYPCALPGIAFRSISADELIKASDDSRLGLNRDFVQAVIMFQQGFTHRAGFVSLENLSSLAAGKYMESERIGYAGYFDWFGRQFPFATKAAKSIGFEFFVRE